MSNTFSYTLEFLDDAIYSKIERLKEEYLRCSECPPDRNCCRFSPNYKVPLEEAEVLRLFGDRRIEDLISEGKLIRIAEDVEAAMRERDTHHKARPFQLIIPCPFLDDRNQCGIHDESRLDECNDFPFLLPDATTFIVDYRCHSVEKSWNRLSRDLRILDGSLFVIVKYVSPFTVREVDLGTFEERLNSGTIPPQRMSINNTDLI